MAAGVGRTLNRFFVAGVPLVVGQVAQIDTLAPQLFAVLRLTAGDPIVLLDDSGHEYEAHIQALSRHHATALVLSGQVCRAEPTTRLTLYQCSLKHEKFEWVLQKGTELGVAAFVPVISERSIVRPAEALLRKYERWQAIIREAAEQCGRGRLPTLGEPVDWCGAVGSLTGAGFLPWEGGVCRRFVGPRCRAHPLTHSPAHPLPPDRPRGRDHRKRSAVGGRARLAVGEPGTTHPARRDGGYCRSLPLPWNTPAIWIARSDIRTIPLLDGAGKVGYNSL